MSASALHPATTSAGSAFEKNPPDVTGRRDTALLAVASAAAATPLLVLARDREPDKEEEDGDALKVRAACDMVRTFSCMDENLRSVPKAPPPSRSGLDTAITARTWEEGGRRTGKERGRSRYKGMEMRRRKRRVKRRWRRTHNINTSTR